MDILTRGLQRQCANYVYNYVKIFPFDGNLNSKIFEKKILGTILCLLDRASL